MANSGFSTSGCIVLIVFHECNKLWGLSAYFGLFINHIPKTDLLWRILGGKLHEQDRKSNESRT